MGTKSAWTPERRARQAEIIRATKPWENATGPITEAGKAASSRNACLSPESAYLRLMLNQARSFAVAAQGRYRHLKSDLDQQRDN